MQCIPYICVILLVPCLVGCQPLESQRIRAIDNAARSPGQETETTKNEKIETLAEGLKDPSPRVRLWAMRATIRHPDPTLSVTLLDKMDSWPKALRRDLLATLLGTDRVDTTALQLFKRLAKDSTQEIRRATILGLGNRQAMHAELWQLLIDHLPASTGETALSSRLSVLAQGWNAVPSLLQALLKAKNGRTKHIDEVLYKITGYRFSTFTPKARALILKLEWMLRYPNRQKGLSDDLESDAIREGLGAAASQIRVLAARVLAAHVPSARGLQRLLAAKLPERYRLAALWGHTAQVVAQQLLDNGTAPIAIDKIPLVGLLEDERKMKELLFLMQDPRVEAVEQAMRMAATLAPSARDSKIVEVLRRKANSQRVETAQLATLSLWKLGRWAASPTKTAEVLLNAMKASTGERLLEYFAAASELASLSASAAFVEELASTYTQVASRATRKRMSQSLMLACSSLKVKECEPAIKAILAHDHPLARELRLRCTLNEAPEDRFLLVNKLLNRKGSRFLPRIRQVLQDIESVGHQPGVEYVLRIALEGNDKSVRIHAARLVGKLQISSLLPLLRQHMQPARGLHAIEIAKVIGGFSDENDREILTKIFDEIPTHHPQKTLIGLAAAKLGSKSALDWAATLSADEKKITQLNGELLLLLAEPKRRGSVVLSYHAHLRSTMRPWPAQ